MIYTQMIIGYPKTTEAMFNNQVRKQPQQAAFEYRYTSSYCNRRKNFRDLFINFEIKIIILKGNLLGNLTCARQFMCKFYIYNKP